MGLLRFKPALRRSSLLLGAVLGILVLFPPVSGLGAETDDPDLERAVQNPVLWSHFRTVVRVYFPLNENNGLAKGGRAHEVDVDGLTQLVFSTYRSVHGYVFQGQHTVTVHQLKNENMLVSLHRIQEITRQLRGQ